MTDSAPQDQQPDTGDTPQPIRRGSVRERWRTQVLLSTLITDSTRVVLLVMADHMQPNGYVCVPRKTLAAAVGRSDRRIAERVCSAVDARLLDRVSKASKGHTGSYRALLSDRVSVPDHSTLRASKRDGLQHAKTDGWVADGGHALEGQSVTDGGHTSTSGAANSQPSLGAAAHGLQGLSDEEEDVEATPAQLAEAASILRRAQLSWGMAS